MPAIRPSMTRSSALGRVSIITTAKVSPSTNMKTRQSRIMVQGRALHLLRNFQQIHGERHTRGPQSLRELGNNSRRHEPANHLPIRSDTALLEEEDVLHADQIADRAGDLRYVGDAAGAITRSRYLNDDLNGGSDL